jgi:hypothetical protein
MAKKSYLVQSRRTLGKLSVKLVSSKPLQSLPQMLLMVFLTLRVNQNVVDENHHELIQVFVKDPIHLVHENCRCIGPNK